jgi:hypothetical protein
MSNFEFEPGQIVILNGCKVHTHWNGKLARVVSGPYIVERADDGARFTTYNVEVPDGRQLVLNASLLAPAPDLRRGSWSAIERMSGWNPLRDVAGRLPVPNSQTLK